MAVRMLIVVCFVFISVLVGASEYNCKFYALYIKGEMVQWVTLLDKAKSDYQQNKSVDLLEDIVRAQYGLVAYYIGANNDAKAMTEIDAADVYLDTLLKEYQNEGWIYALSASFDGFRLIVNPYRFFLRGPSILSAINKSSELSPKDFDVLFLKANQTFYLPSFIGGDQKKGLVMYENLYVKLKKKDIAKEKDWFSLMYLTSYGIACTYAHQYEKAVEVYQLILEKEPDYNWVRKELLPEAQNKTDNKYLKDREGKVNKGS